MQHDLFQSGHDIDLHFGLSQIFHLEDQIIVHLTRIDKRNTMQAKLMSCLYWIESYYTEKLVSLDRLFLEVLLSGG